MSGEEVDVEGGVAEGRVVWVVVDEGGGVGGVVVVVVLLVDRWGDGLDAMGDRREEAVGGDFGWGGTTVERQRERETPPSRARSQGHGFFLHPQPQFGQPGSAAAVHMPRVDGWGEG
jgi:hypothetical protein